MEKLFARIRKEAKATSYARPTAILHWNSMFEFSMYAAHKKMIDWRRLASALRQRHSRALGQQEEEGHGNVGEDNRRELEER